MDKFDDPLGKVYRLEQREPGRLIKTAAEFLAGFTPPDYLWDGLMFRGYVYSLTAQTGAGKTAFSLLLAACIGRGTPLAGRELERGRVLYLAGENPDDVRMRLIGMGQEMGFDAEALPIVFIDGRKDLKVVEAQVREEVEALGGVSLVVVDTRAAFFHGTELNDNVEVGNEARLYRAYTALPGVPVVLVNSHPIKSATDGTLEPLGGGAFVNEVDGNFTLAKAAGGMVLHWYKKLRGPDFAPMPFGLRTITADRLRDKKGRLLPTVMAHELEAGALAFAPKRTPRPGSGLALLLQIIDRALIDAGEFLKGSATVPHDCRSITREHLKRYLPLEGYWDNDTPSEVKRSGFNRDLRELKSHGLIGLTDEHVWRPSK